MNNRTKDVSEKDMVFYDDEVIDELVDSDQLDHVEAAFMKGYIDSEKE